MAFHNAAPIRSPVRGWRGFSKSRGLRASVPLFPLPHPAPSTVLLSPHFSRGPNAKTSFTRPEFRSRRSGTLATPANVYRLVFTCASGACFICPEDDITLTPSPRSQENWRWYRWISNYESARRENIQYGWKRRRWRRPLSWIKTSKVHNRRMRPTKTMTNCWCSKNRFCMKSKRPKSAIEKFRGSFFHSQTRPEIKVSPIKTDKGRHVLLRSRY